MRQAAIDVMIGLVILGALICALPVLLGYFVTRWCKRWSAASRSGPLV